MFEKIAGYDDVKEELLRVKGWVLNKEIRENKNIRLPKGILLHGIPGNGKTLFVKEYSESFGVPIINIIGNEENIPLEIHNAFLESKKNDFSIIVIDELDLLLESGSDIERVLQAELDGVDSSSNVLVLATANSIHKISEAILRSGRIDRTIYIGLPDKSSRKELLEFYINKLEINGDIDTDYLSQIIHRTTCSDITSILNDALLRCGKNLTTQDIEVSYYRIINKEYSYLDKYDASKARYEIAVHEVGHALLIYKNKKDYTFYKAFFEKNYKAGGTRYFPVKEDYENSEIFFERVEIDLGGHVATKLIFKYFDGGSMDDLQDARQSAVRLVNKLGLTGAEHILPWYSIQERMESEERKRKNEKEIEKIIKKSMKSVKKYLKKHKKELLYLSDIMMKKGFIDNKDLEMVMAKA